MVEQGKELLQLICTKIGAGVLYVCALCGQLVILLQAALRQIPKVNWGEHSDKCHFWVRIHCP
jgi:hypothetical protein